MNGSACSSNCVRGSAGVRSMSSISGHITPRSSMSRWGSSATHVVDDIGAPLEKFTMVEPMTTRGYSPTSAAAAEPPAGRYEAPTATGPLDAAVEVPGSKSLTNRELILSALADAPSRIQSPLHSADSLRMEEALRALGVGVERVPGEGSFGDDLDITPAHALKGG